MSGRVRRSRRVVGLLVVSLFCLLIPGSAVRAGIPWGQGGVNFALAFPQHEFKENVDRLGFGLGLQLEGGPQRMPISFGLSGGFAIYGSETRHEPFSMTIPDVTVKVQTTNNLAFGHLYMKVMPRYGSVRPYVMGLVGFHYLFTQTSIKSEDNEEHEIASSTNFSDATSSYGFAFGLQVKVAEKISKSAKTGKTQRIRTYVDLRLTNLRGGEADYLKEGSIRREGGKVAYDVSRSPTDVLLFQIGIAAGF